MKNEIIFSLFKRIVCSLIVLFLLITFLFFLLRISPGEPYQKFISPDLNPKLAAMVRESFNLDSSLLTQYKSFVFNLARGNLGISYTYRIPVIKVISEYFPFTFMFSFISFIIQIVTAFGLAYVSVKKIRGKLDRTISETSLVFYALPSFVVGVLLIYIFSVTFNILPSSGFESFETSTFSFWGRISDYISHMILPTITFSLPFIAEYFKYLRDNLEEVRLKPFVENLRANGIGENTIMWKHIIPNAVSPLISIAGVEFGLLFSGALIVEVIFSLPGMGRLTVNAIFARDYPLIVGCTFISGVLVIFANLVADVVHALIDKRLIKSV